MLPEHILLFLQMVKRIFDLNKGILIRHLIQTLFFLPVEKGDGVTWPFFNKKCWSDRVRLCGGRNYISGCSFWTCDCGMMGGSQGLQDLRTQRCIGLQAHVTGRHQHLYASCIPYTGAGMWCSVQCQQTTAITSTRGRHRTPSSSETALASIIKKLQKVKSIKRSTLKQIKGE